MGRLKIVGIIDEDPFNPATWSGSAVYFFKALLHQGALHAAISAEPSKATKWFYKAFNFQSGIDRWKFKYHLDTDYYRQMTRTARHALNRIYATKYDVILQVGSWYDMTGYGGKPVVSYHDGNLSALLSSPYGYPSISQTYIRRTLEYERKLFNRINLVFPMSKWLANSFVRDFGVAAEKVFPVGAGINLPYTADVTNKSYDSPRILFVGKNFKRKGGDYLLQAFKLVRQEIKNAELVIIGPELKNLPEGVLCKGFFSKMNNEGLEKLLNEYQSATVFVLPSLYEPFGISLVEAMAHRLPCVGTDICAIPEIVQHGKTGYIVPSENPVVLAEKLLKLLKEPERCRDFGNAGYHHYSQNYSWNSVAARICEIIDNNL